jgi:uncharacterized protein (TIGR02646 family)
MRYIHLSKIEKDISSDWLRRARDALDQVKAAPEAERANAVNAHKTLWQNLKELLRSASYGKCWYCESIDDRSDNAVDHFRPKNRVAECTDPGHSGYWWLAFDWRNYRFSCTYCNSYRKSTAGAGGKQDHFPLWREERRAKRPDDPLDDEQPLLLDPTRVADVAEITFDDDGRAVPARTKEGNRYSFERASRTIETYHLNHPLIVERRAELMRKVRKYLADADKFFRKLDGGDISAETAYECRLQDVYHAFIQEAEYSAAVRATVGSKRATCPSADELFSRIPL